VPWLPARSLTLEEHWNPDPGSQQVQIGDSLTRNITLRAEGLSSTQLPPLPATEIIGLRRYPDQPLLRNEISERGMTANREEREALVPTHAARWPCRRWKWPGGTPAKTIWNTAACQRAP
jgi:hypothetical protein